MDFYKDIDSTTGKPVSDNAFQRVLHTCAELQFYSQIPRNLSPRGQCAATWQSHADAAPEGPEGHVIAHRLRLKVVETAVPDESESQGERISTAIVLEDTKDDAVWLVVPYTSASVVEQSCDSSRAFALQGRTPNGGLHMFGIWFDPGDDAFHFSLALQEARKAMAWDRRTAIIQQQKKKVPIEKDLSLPEGQMITAQPAGMGRRKNTKPKVDEGSSDLQSFALAPPPSYVRR